MEVLTLTLTFAIITAFSQATSTLVTRPQPQLNLSSMLNHTQQHVNKFYFILYFYLYFYFETLIHTRLL
jgi:hypothetical protein